MRAQAVLRPAVARLSEAGLPSPQADARTLLAHLLKVDPSRLVLADIDQEGADRFAGLIERRAAGQPVQYLTGVAYFRRVSLRVGPGVFIPRPETEALAGWAIDRLRDRSAAGAPVVVELCAGSGAISLAIEAESAGCRQYAVELDPAAYVYLEANLAGHAVRPVLADMSEALPELDGRVDLVVANPPYIPVGEAALVAPDVLEHEPAAALFSGEDGLDGLRVVAAVAQRLLAPGGRLGVEHDETTGAGAIAWLADTGAFERIEAHRDLAGRPRFVTARKLAG